MLSLFNDMSMGAPDGRIALRGERILLDKELVQVGGHSFKAASPAEAAKLAALIRRAAAGKLRLDPSTSIKVLPSHLPPKCISIISASGTLSLRFDNDEALQSWAKAIENVCKGKIQTSI